MLRRRLLLHAAGLAPALVRAAQAGRSSAPVPLIFDTDIGNDVDDAMALVFLLNSPEAAVRGVTTVDRNTWRRAQSALRLMAAMGRTDLPCAAVCVAPMAQPGRMRGLAARVAQIDISAGGPDPDLAELAAQRPSPQHAWRRRVRRGGPWPRP